MLERGHAPLHVRQHTARALGQDHVVIGAPGAQRDVHDVIEHAGIDVGPGIHAVQALVVGVGGIADGMALPLPVDAHHQFLGIIRDDDLAQGADLGHIHLVLDPVAAPLGIGVQTAADTGQRAHHGVLIKEKFLGQQQALQQFRTNQHRLFPEVLLIDGLEHAQAFGVHLLVGIGDDALAKADTVIGRGPVHGIGTVTGFFRGDTGFCPLGDEHVWLLVEI